MLLNFIGFEKFVLILRSVQIRFRSSYFLSTSTSVKSEKEQKNPMVMKYRPIIVELNTYKLECDEVKELFSALAFTSEDLHKFEVMEFSSI